MDALPSVEFKRRRFREPKKFAPIVFVACTMMILYSVFMLSHCLPLLQVGAAIGEVNANFRRRGVLQVAFFHVVTAMVIVCYVFSIVVHPGEVPDSPEWEVPAEDVSSRQSAGYGSWNHQETKRSGERRNCKWCNKYKPDRCHHCRVCQMCILKMDHHCPWIYNCVGLGNYKYFYLLLLYSTIDLHFIIWSMGVSVFRVAKDPDACFLHMCSILFGETLAIFVGCLVTAFFGLHSWLMISGLTTIEWFEKKMPNKGQIKSERPSSSRSPYDLGAAANARAALGSNLWAALLPVAPHIGDGLSFVAAETRLTSDIVARDVCRKKTHRVTPRRLPQDGLSSFGSALEPDGGYANESATISILD